MQPPEDDLEATPDENRPPRRPRAKGFANEELALHGRRLARLGGLVSGFAHEIKNPLSTIGLNLGLLEEELESGDGARERRMLERTRRLKREVERLQGILDDFLSYVRGPRPQLQRLALNSVVRELCDLVAPGLEKQGLSVSLHLQEGLPTIEADGSLLHQALLNLVKNAEQAVLGTGRGGEILLSTGKEERDEIEWVFVSVIDSGPGMDDATLAEIFQPYFSTKKGGTGLGLPIAQRLVQDQGGEITVESQLGTGTRFTLRLPRTQEARARIAERDAAQFDFDDGEVLGHSPGPAARPAPPRGPGLGEGDAQ